jgi:predicted AlkP superfamily pyrophosphatase or phosphodiesterase
MKKTVVICAVGLTRRLLGEHTPFLRDFALQHPPRTVGAVTPALTCSVQATYLTGKLPCEHGIVGNGWYFRDECEVKFWRQSNTLVQAPKLWEMAKALDPSFTCANLFWWYNMYSAADFSVTPRPMYPADGRKLPDVYSHPANLRTWLQNDLGQFPLFRFWGPAADITSTRWIADAALLLDQRHNPTLTLIYLPHLDYCLQKHGPDISACAAELHELDTEVAKLVGHYRHAGADVVILSEYGITAVRQPVHLNRELRKAGLLAVREELGRELLDAGASAAFAVADHQVAHVYVNDPKQLDHVRHIVRSCEGVSAVLEGETKAAAGLDHPRAGELIALASPEAWFTYYYWLDDTRAPDFARTVDIHRKPGYDPAELFIDPAIAAPKARIAWTLTKKKLGFRTLLDVIPLDAALVRGSHGLPAGDAMDAPLLMSTSDALLPQGEVPATDVCGLLLRHLVGA